VGDVSVGDDVTVVVARDEVVWVAWVVGVAWLVGVVGAGKVGRDGGAAVDGVKVVGTIVVDVSGA
jgi:hypothetical protein